MGVLMKPLRRKSREHELETDSFRGQVFEVEDCLARNGEVKNVPRVF